MNFKMIKDDWEALASRDALWSILTDSSRANGGWDLSEFMATGEREIQTVLNHLEEIAHSPNYGGAALDFGCGVGRLTQALVRRFSHCVGLDISQRMIDKAETYNQYKHCSYLLHDGQELPFEEDCFSFIYSNIVLQHLPADLALQSIQELVRVLAVDGVLVFGVQDRFAAPDLAARLTLLRNKLRLRSRVQIAMGLKPHHMQMHCLPERVVREALGGAIIADVQLTNTAATNYNGNLSYLREAPIVGYVGKQYCVRKRDRSLVNKKFDKSSEGKQIA